MKLPKIVPSRGLLTLLAWVAICAILVAVLAWKSVDLHNDHQHRDQQARAIRVAEAQVVDLTTLDATTVKAKIAAMAERSTAAFRSELTGIESAFVKAVTTAKLQATGRIDAAALQSASSNAATVIVASTATVSSGGNGASPTARQYRMKVDLVRSGSSWLIQGMEFVS